MFPRRICLRLLAAESRTLMDKCRPSRKQRYRLFGHRDYAIASIAMGMIALGPNNVGAITLSHSDALKIGKRVWQNECNGTMSGLTAWNKGEDFASLGVGHFLVDTVDLQAEFLVARLEAALPKMLAEAAPADRTNVQQQFELLSKTPQGCYALVDYVNFKGEGVLRTERYHGEGWGLLQVLEAIHGNSDADAVDTFARAATAVLTRRVRNSPPDRHESRWLTGWLRRVNSYSGG